MSVLVTGGSGHIGNTLVRQLVARGERVRVLAHGSMTSLEGLGVELIEGDVRDAAVVRAAVEGVDVVYHLAAVISIDGDRHGLARSVNVVGPRTVAAAALEAGVRRMVHVSSIHAFDHHPYDTPLDESRRPAGPRHPVYDQTKVAGEAEVRSLIARGLDAVVVNPTGVIGPNDFGPSNMGDFLLGVARRRYPLAPRGGFNWVDVRDVTRSIVAAADRGRRGERYILGGHWYSLFEMSELGETITGVPSPFGELPLGFAKAASHVMLTASRLTMTRTVFTPDAVVALGSNRHVSSAKAAQELGHTARPTIETLRDTYTWFARRGSLPHLAEKLLGSRSEVLQAA